MHAEQQSLGIEEPPPSWALRITSDLLWYAWSDTCVSRSCSHWLSRAVLAHFRRAGVIIVSSDGRRS